MKIAHWLHRWGPEMLLFLLGVVLRAAMAWRYDPAWSYDSEWHWEVVRWIFDHHKVPTPDDVFEAQHPPLYYAFAAWLLHLGVTRAGMAWVSIICGISRLALIWAGLELFVSHSRTARLAGLGLAAVLAASVHPDGMVYPEAMSGMWIAAALLLTPLVFRRPARTRWPLAAMLGLILGLAMLTKVSAVVVIAAIGATALLEFVFAKQPWKTRCSGLLAWAVMLAVCIGVSGWYYARNVRLYHRPFVTSFDLRSQHFLIAAKDKVPYLDRRPSGYFLGWEPSIVAFPYFPTGMGLHPRFFPVVLASTFVDYYNYSFSGIEPSTKAPFSSLGRPLTRRVLTVSQFAVVGGIAIALATCAAWFRVTPWLFRRRDWGRLALVLLPFFTLIAALHFAISYPIDSYGVVKGIYMQFGAPPLYALFGVAVAWAHRKPERWPVFSLLWIALWLVASYTLYCRLRLLFVPPLRLL